MHQDKNENACRCLADRIGRELANGLRIDADIVDYIESTHGSDCLENLPDFLKDPQEGGDETLTALVFTPDESFRRHLEKTLVNQRFQQEAVNRVAGMLMQYPPEVTLYLPPLDTQWKICLPPNAAAHLVSQLKITRRMPESIKKIVAGHIPEEWSTAVFVHFRHSGIDFTPRRIDFFDKFFAAFSPENTLFFPCLKLATDLFAEDANGDTEPLSLFQAKKRTLFRHLQMAGSFQRKLDRSNVETLLLTGNRAPYIDLPNSRRQMHMIDVIADTVYGVACLIDMPSDATEIQKNVSADSVKEFMRFFS